MFTRRNLSWLSSVLKKPLSSLELFTRESLSKEFKESYVLNPEVPAFIAYLKEFGSVGLFKDEDYVLKKKRTSRVRKTTKTKRKNR